MKRLAARETVVVVPVVVEPVEVVVPALAIEIEVGEVEVAVRIALKYAMRLPVHRPLNALRTESNLETLSP